MRALGLRPERCGSRDGFVGDRATGIGLVILGLAGAAIAAYLALVQLGAIAHVWDPVFGERSSRAVLTSALSRALPVPDASFGAIAYLLEAGLAFAGTTRRFEGSRPVAVGCALVAAGLLVAAVAVVAAAAASREGARAAGSPGSTIGRSHR